MFIRNRNLWENSVSKEIAYEEDESTTRLKIIKAFAVYGCKNVLKGIPYLCTEELSCLQCLEKDSRGDHTFGCDYDVL